MILKKIIAGLFLLFFLNGCVQSAALLGPAIQLLALATSFKLVFHMDLTKQLKKLQESQLLKILKVFVDDNKIKVEEEENHEEFFALVKSRIEKTSKIIQLANQ